MSPENRGIFIVGFLSLGILFLLLAFYFGKTDNLYSGSQLAKVSRFTGQVDLINYGMTKRTKILQAESVQNLDSIQTDDIGEAILQFETGQEVRVLPSSIVTIEKLDPKVNNRNSDNDQLQILVVIKAGDIKIKKTGREQSLFISKNGGRIVAENYQESLLNRSRVQQETKSNPADNEFNLSLSEEEITTTLGQHRSQFFKCFARLVQSTLTDKGEASLTFTIQNNGHPSYLDVITSINDENFKKCLLEVMSRIEFKPFQGPAVSTVFPLKFEP